MIRTATVGSWPIPRHHKAELTAYYRGDVSDVEAHDLLQQAARVAIAEQRACGLDQIMGGEVFAPDFVHHVPPRLAGLECLRKRDHGVGYEGLGVYKIVGDLSAPAAGAMRWPFAGSVRSRPTWRKPRCPQR